MSEKERKKEREREKANIRATCHLILISMNKSFAISTERNQ